jgi:Tfp pilus assembly protein PilF
MASSPFPNSFLILLTGSEAVTMAPFAAAACLAESKCPNVGRLILLSTMIALCSGCTGKGHNIQGVKLYQQGQHHAALQKFQQAITTNPNNADGYYNLAATYHQLGKMNNDQSLLVQAENLYNQGLQYDPNHPETYRGLSVLLVETKRPESAFRLLEGWTTRQPQVANAKVELARLHEEFGDKEAAKRQLEAALAKDTTSARAWAALARLREEAGDHGQALANYQRALQLNPSQPQISQRIATLQSSLGTSAPVAPINSTRMAKQPKKQSPRSY